MVGVPTIKERAQGSENGADAAPVSGENVSLTCPRLSSTVLRLKSVLIAALMYLYVSFGVSMRLKAGAFDSKTNQRLGLLFQA